MSYDEDEGFGGDFRMSDYGEDEEDAVADFPLEDEYDLEDENPERDG